MGSGKGGSPPTEQPIVAEPVQDFSAMYEAMGQMAAMNAASNAQTMDAMMMMQSQAPEPTATTDQDWQKRSDALKEKIATNTANSKRGRASTILTSPLTDEQVKTTESVLTGS